MKNIFKISLLVLTCWLVSCDNISELNVDPNNSSSARPQEVLTSAIGYFAFVMDAQYNDQAFLWGQFWTWGTGVSLGDNPRYIMLPSEANQAWARSYSDALTDLKFLREGTHAGYRGIALTLEACIYQYLVDHFGDVPFSQAVKGAIADGSILAPAYDNDADIYPQLVTKLDEAIADLESARGAQGVTVGAEDLIYGGNYDNWIKFANSLKLRVLLRMSDVVDVAADVQETINYGQFIEKADDFAEVHFAGTTGSENPMYAWEESGIGLFYKAATTVTNVMDEYNDPRKFAVYLPAVNFPSEIRAGDNNAIALDFQAVSEDWSDPAPVTYGPAVPTIFMSNWETYFLRAEAAIKYNTGEDAAALFAQGIAANFAYLGTAGAAEYVAQFDFAGSTSQGQLNLICIQKWLASTGLQEAEGWIEARRCDTPENPIFTGANGIYQTPLQSALPDRVFPTRWLYPESEQTLNGANTPDNLSITDKVFWDR
jgi:hypothetical protein